MIWKIILRRFKRFEEASFELPSHVVLAGPNNCGKTSVLQAVAAWGLGLQRWKQLNDFKKHQGGYTKAPIARQAFSAVPLRAFDLLWRERSYKKGGNAIEIEVFGKLGWKITMELIADSSEQIYVRPHKDADPDVLRQIDLQPVYVPAMTGLGIEEPVYQLPKLEQLLGQGKAGDVIRNLLVIAHQSEPAWRSLTAAIQKLFGYELIPPDSSGADIVADYRMAAGGGKLDIASAGSGFQQVLLLLTFLHSRPSSVLLLDEPDAHLHVILQDAIYEELRSVAAKQNSQLIIATHSEVIIDSVDPRELCVLFDGPRLLENVVERGRLTKALRILTNLDIMLAINAPGVLYVEDKTDLSILTEWAKILDHPAYALLTKDLFWKPTGPGLSAKDHYETLRLVRDDLPGIELIDGDAHPDKGETPITGSGLQRVRWRRYEIESYLVHPEVLSRYIRHVAGENAAEYVAAMKQYFEDNFPPAVVRDPLGDHEFLNGTKARTKLLPPLLDEAGQQGLPHTRYHEIAALMERDEIHPEVIEKLDAIQRAFRR